MSDTYQDKRIRLVSLIHTASGAPRPAQDIDFVLLLAAQRKAKIYLKVPKGDVAFADRNYSVESRPSRTQMRTFEVNSRQFAEHMNKGLRTTYGDDDAVEISLHGKIHPEVIYLALGAWHAEALRVAQYAQLDTFPSGLTPHPNPRLARHDWLVPRHFTSALRLCSTERASRGFVISTFGTTASVHRELSESPERIEPKDIWIDESVAALLEDPEASDRNDPFQHRNRVPGVYALYCAARDYYAPLKAKQIKFEEVQAKVAKQLPMLTEDEAPELVKFINPRYRRNSGIGRHNRRELDQDIVKSPNFIAKYKPGRFINDSLGLVLYATDQWLDSQTKFKEGITDEPLTLFDFRERLRKWGFYELELEALILVIRWRQPTTRT